MNVSALGFVVSEWNGVVRREVIFFSFFFVCVYVPFLSERARMLVKFTVLIYIFFFSIAISFNHKTSAN